MSSSDKPTFCTYYRVRSSKGRQIQNDQKSQEEAVEIARKEKSHWAGQSFYIERVTVIIEPLEKI